MAAPGLLEWAEMGLDVVSVVLELLAVAVIVYGVALALTDFVRTSLKHREPVRGRVALVHDLVFGLDILIAADIIRTATTPSLQDLGLLAGIVAVRIVLTFVLNREMRGLEHGDGDEGDDGGRPGSDHSRTRSAKSDASM